MRKNFAQNIRSIQVNAQDEYDKLREIYTEEWVSDSQGRETSYDFLFCEHFRELPFAGTHLTLDEFTEACGYSFDNELEEFQTETLIDFCEFFFNLISKLSAEENVELPLIYQKVPRAERQVRVREALEHVGLSHRAKHLPTELSGGQQQRVAIARALVTRPSLILADEPTGNLDSRTSREIMNMFHELHAQGNTIVLITHDNDVAKQAPRSVHILDGRLTEVER